MARLLALLLIVAAIPVFAASPKATPKKKPAKTPVKVKATPTPKKNICPDLLEQKLSLGLDLGASDTSLGEKRAALTALQAEVTKDAPVVDLTNEAPEPPIATPAATPATDPAAREKIAALQTEIAELEASRLEVSRKLERVKSTYAQSCEKKSATVP